jgi:hypothetical protein
VRIVSVDTNPVDLHSHDTKKKVKSMTHRDGDRERDRWTHRELVPFSESCKMAVMSFWEQLGIFEGARCSQGLEKE